MLKAFTANSKTILSLDFNRDKTCSQICGYCYVENMERIYPSYSAKTLRNYNWALTDPEGFANQLNTEYWKLRNSKSEKWKRLNTLPVRIYGSGDYIPGHLKFLSKLTFKFFIISKTLTLKTMQSQVEQLFKLPNLTSIVFSFDSDNLSNYTNVKKYFNQDRCKFSYTSMPSEFSDVHTKKSFDIFFNIGNKKVDKEASATYKEQCPCDSGMLAHAESCSHCNKCWRSSFTKDKF